MTTPDQTRAIAAGLSEVQKLAVVSMDAYCDSDTPCRNAKDLALKMGGDWTRDDARCVARELVKLGLAECESGLITSDGVFYGSGWLLTEEGLRVRTILQEPKP